MMAQLALVAGEEALQQVVEAEVVAAVRTFRIKVRRAAVGFPQAEPPHKALDVLNAAQVGRLEAPERHRLETSSRGRLELLHSRQGEPVRRTKLSASKA
jgi:hypothetical protein